MGGVGDFWGYFWGVLFGLQGPGRLSSDNMVRVRDLLLLLALVCLGTIDERLRALFRTADRNKSGGLSVDELVTLVRIADALSPDDTAAALEPTMLVRQARHQFWII